MNISMLYHASAEIKNLADDSDDLIVRAQSGDNEAFGLIFELHYRFVYKFIYAMLGEKESAEELTQETFLGAFRGINGLRGDAHLKTWLCGIAKNIVYKQLRTNRKEGTKSADAIESLNVFDEKNLSPDREFLSKELNRLIGAALKKLDADKRLVFTLKELQNLSYREISEITGSTISKLKVDLHRAKTEMRILLQSVREAKNEV
ncbi:MAG: RNA polymerase sigma factor [Pyrinomonadaceae bacterium]|jgi:RNA polymerase sigma-70 factor (ECF subfamily)